MGEKWVKNALTIESLYIELVGQLVGQSQIALAIKVFNFPFPFALKTQIIFQPLMMS